jgi:rod shape-determining protein MreD
MSEHPASRTLPIIMTFIVALILMITPLPGWAEPYRPDFVVLTLIYWSMTLPQNYSVGSAWIVGVVLDVAQGTLLGQHALALILIVYITVKFHLQLRVFPKLQFLATVFALLALHQFILFWINGVVGVNAPAETYWGPVISGTLVWPILAVILAGIYQRVRR